MADTCDVAAVAAVALTEPGHAGAEYDVTGPQALSYADVAAKLTAAMRRPITYIDAPDDAVRQALLGAGLSEWFVGALVGLYQDYRRSGTGGYAAQVTDTVHRLTGRPPRSLDDLLNEIAPASNGAPWHGRGLNGPQAARRRSRPSPVTANLAPRRPWSSSPHRAIIVRDHPPHLPAAKPAILSVGGDRMAACPTRRRPRSWPASR